MKLLLCLKCQSVFNLIVEKVKSCECGKSEGQYAEDGKLAWFKGPCLPLGFDNQSLAEALHNQPEKGWGKDFTAFVIQKQCPSFTRIGDEPKLPPSRDKQVEELLIKHLLKHDSLKKDKTSKKGKK